MKVISITHPTPKPRRVCVTEGSIPVTHYDTFKEFLVANKLRVSISDKYSGHGWRNVHECHAMIVGVDVEADIGTYYSGMKSTPAKALAELTRKTHGATITIWSDPPRQLRPRIKRRKVRDAQALLDALGGE